LNELAERAAIIDLLATYALAVDTKDWDLYESVFAEDAVIDYTSSGGVRGNRQEARKWVSEALEPFTMTQHLVTNHHIDLRGDTAGCRCDFFNPMGLPDRTGELKVFFVGGLYHDRLRRTAKGWLITERFEQMLWTKDLPRGAASQER
jgi:3-phenylpropionate/cinnamic acid dioxygenase small subunit